MSANARSPLELFRFYTGDLNYCYVFYPTDASLASDLFLYLLFFETLRLQLSALQVCSCPSVTVLMPCYLNTCQSTVGRMQWNLEVPTRYSVFALLRSIFCHVGSPNTGKHVCQKLQCLLFKITCDNVMVLSGLVNASSLSISLARCILCAFSASIPFAQETKNDFFNFQTIACFWPYALQTFKSSASF